MKIKILSCFALAVLCACAPDNKEESPTRAAVPMQAEALAPTDFLDGDQIGVSAREYNMPVCTNSAWTYLSGHFVGTDTIALERGSELRLSAYYPYEDQLDSINPTLTIDTRLPEYTDYLWATDTLQMTASGMQASLRFRHVLSRIELWLHPSPEFPSSETVSLTMSGVKAKVEKHVVTGAENLSGDATIELTTLPEQALQILIPAQTALPVITFQYAEYNYQVTPATEQTYTGGRSYRYDIAFGPEVDPTISYVPINEQSTNFQLSPRR